MTFYNKKLGFFTHQLAVVERLFLHLGPALVAVAVVERWPLSRDESKCMGFPLGQKSDCCREVAVSGGSTALIFLLWSVIMLIFS